MSASLRPRDMRRLRTKRPTRARSSARCSAVGKFERVTADVRGTSASCDERDPEATAQWRELLGNAQPYGIEDIRLAIRSGGRNGCPRGALSSAAERAEDVEYFSAIRRADSAQSGIVA